MTELSDHQLEAIEKIQNGSILCGGVGSGKSRTALAYYVFKVCQGSVPCNGLGIFKEMVYPRDIYIITTAKKRDTKEWENEAKSFNIFPDKELSLSKVKLTIDSWNNIKKYQDISGAFFIFDEQRVVGYGAWTKSFLKITGRNRWILLSATPGDVWMDYCPVFIANGFFKNKTDFCNKHVRWARGAKYPKIDGYYDQGILTRYRNKILIPMDDDRITERHKLSVSCNYDKNRYKMIWKDRWDIYDECPIKESGKLFYLMRRVVNEDLDRQVKLVELLEQNPKTIIFYNFDYELVILRDLLDRIMIPYTEWNGNKHEECPTGETWSYLVQYSAGCEGWNCITTDTMIFYSLNYSYRITEQAMGRIDRMNTPYKDLYYYTLESHAPIDIAIKRALANKRNFNERAYMKGVKK